MGNFRRNLRLESASSGPAYPLKLPLYFPVCFQNGQDTVMLTIRKRRLQGSKTEDVEGYLKHQLGPARASEQFFWDEVIFTIHQGSGGRTPGQMFS
jgi:hypothetical protein